ncbi:MAG: ATP-binding protein [Bacillota bacterium]
MSSIRLPSLHRTLAAGVLLISFTVMVGWLIKNQHLVGMYFSFSPMKFNAALSFCFLALGIFFSDRDYFKIGRFCAVAVFIFAGLTFIQYLFGVDFGIDCFFIKPYYQVNLQYLGRMSATTTIAMMIASLGLFFDKRTVLSQYIRVTCSALLIGFGLIGIGGYFLHVNTQYGWGSFEQMAIPTSLCFLMIAVALLAQLHGNLMDGGLTKNYDFVVLISGILFSVTFYQILFFKDYQRNKAVTQIRAESLIEGFDNTFYPLLRALEHMSRRFESHRYPSRDVWQIDADSYVNDFIGVKRLMWADKDMRTRWAYPMSDFGERVVGMNLADEADIRDAVQWVIRNRKPSLSQVIQLRSGGSGFVMFVPVTHESQLLGMLAVAVRADVFFQRVVQEPGYFVSIRENGKTLMSTGQISEAYARDWSYKVPYRTLNSSWDITVTPSPEVVQANTSYLSGAVIVVGVLVSLLVSLALRLSGVARVSERKMKMALEWQEAGRNSVPLLMIQLDNEGQIFTLNKAAKDLLEYTEEDLKGRIPAVYGDRQELAEIRGMLEAELGRQVSSGKDFLEALFEKGLNVGMERTFVSKSGRRINVILSISRVRDEKGNINGYLGVAEDITQKKERERLLKEQEEKILVSSRLASLGEMAAGIAHEINNPLTIINGYVSVLRKNLQQKGLGDDAEINRRVESIESTVQRIAKIVRGLRSYAHGAHDGELVPVSVDTIIDDTLAFCYDRFKNEGIKLVVRVEPGTVVRCRSHQISQVLLNLLNNSCDAVQSSQDKRVTVEAHKVGDGVEVSVSDSGPGIPFERREKIMQPFYTTKEVGKGVGLGLSISQGIMQAHGGKIYLDQESPQTRFVFWIPS